MLIGKYKKLNLRVVLMGLDKWLISQYAQEFIANSFMMIKRS